MIVLISDLFNCFVKLNIRNKLLNTCRIFYLLFFDILKFVSKWEKCYFTEEPPFPSYYIPPVEPLDHSKKTVMPTPISGQVWICC